MKPLSLEQRLIQRIDRKSGDVFLRADFADLGGYDQVGRVLRGLVRKGRLLRIGQGIYTRARPALSDGRPVSFKGLRALVAEALQRVGVETVPTRLEEAYNAGQTTQIPAGRVIGVRKRVRRKIGYDGIYMGFENARSGSR